MEGEVSDDASRHMPGKPPTLHLAVPRQTHTRDRQLIPLHRGAMQEDFKCLVDFKHESVHSVSNVAVRSKAL